MTGLRVCRFERAAAPAWDAFVEAHPDASFCHRAGWEVLLARLPGYHPHYLHAERDGQVVGVLPLAIVERPFGGRSLISTPFCSYGGVVAADREAAALLEHEALRVGEKAGAADVELRGPVSAGSSWVETSANATFRRALPADADAILDAIPRKQRAEVRKANQAGLRVETHRDVRRFFSVYSQSLRNLGSPVGPRAYYEGLLEIFGADCEIVSVHHAGEDLATVLSFHHRGTVMPYHGGGRPAARRASAFPYMYWWVMRDAASRRGATMFDFGRSPADGSAAAFKRNFGFEPTPLVYARHALGNNTVRSEVSEADRRYRAAIAVWRRLPLCVANRLGPWALRAVV